MRLLSDREHDERSAALNAVQLARREEIPLHTRAVQRGTALAAIYGWAPDAVRRGLLGIPYATPRDARA